MRYCLIVLLLLCSSCIQIGSDPQPLNYYLLEAPTNPASIYSGQKLNIAVELINIPEYLDQPQIVTYGQKNSVKINTGHRWANPLSENILQVIRENLARSFPDSIVTIQPWEQAASPPTKLKLSIDKFSGKPGQEINVALRWQIVKADGKSQHGTFTDQHPIEETIDDLVAGLNDSLNRFSRFIAKQLVN